MCCSGRCVGGGGRCAAGAALARPRASRLLRLAAPCAIALHWACIDQCKTGARDRRTQGTGQLRRKYLDHWMAAGNVTGKVKRTATCAAGRGCHRPPYNLERTPKPQVGAGQAGKGRTRVPEGLSSPRAPDICLSGPGSLSIKHTRVGQWGARSHAAAALFEAPRHRGTLHPTPAGAAASRRRSIPEP
jgi:hypothetical protein